MTLALLRDLFRDESLIEHLTASAPPVVRTVNKVERNGRVTYEVDEGGSEPPDQNGRSLSAAMVQLIGSFTHELNFYPPRFPVRRAIAEWDRSCRRRHRGLNWADHATPICGQMLWNVVADGASVYWCSTEYGISYPRADRLIAAGERFVADRLAKWDEERLGLREQGGKVYHDRAHCRDCRPVDEKLGLLHDRTLCSVCREEEAG